jgi:hypothetical protein
VGFKKGEWSVHPQDEEMSGAPTRGRRPSLGCCPHLLYKGVVVLLSSFTPSYPCSLPSLPHAAPCSVRLGEALPKYFYTTPYLVEEGGGGVGGVPEDPLLPLPAGHGGRQQAVRVTEYGCAARCGALLQDLEIGKHTTTSSTF